MRRAAAHTGGRGVRGGGHGGRPFAFSPPGTWSGVGWGQTPHARQGISRGNTLPSTLHWAPPAPLNRTESLILAAEAAGQDKQTPAGAINFFGSNVNHERRFVPDEEDSGSEADMEQDGGADTVDVEDSDGAHAQGHSAQAMARAAALEQEKLALASENQRLNAEVALLRSALHAAHRALARQCRSAGPSHVHRHYSWSVRERSCGAVMVWPDGARTHALSGGSAALGGCAEAPAWL
ncbi:hypothetical protein WJX81_000880 [Elliptochloris bilobata]|uniref:Uncharacterized protein n=1 Tax=Elliptochloris bilobata TaxID=381761 RepID=A0AAW1SA35_9CHLO